MTAMAWILFFAFLYYVFDYSILQRNNPNQNVATVSNDGIKEIVLQRNPYGHYVASGSINLQTVTFLLDTGASDVAIPEDLADRLGLEKAHAIMVKTANGNVKAYRTRLDSVAVGDIRLYDVKATILTNMHGEDVLLGMSFLKHFELIQKGKSLTIRQ